MKFNFRKETKTAKFPTRHTPYSAGIDFYSDTDIIIPAGGNGVVSTGISWNPDTIEGQIGEDKIVCLVIQSRSGLAFRSGIEASNAGVIDQDYITTNENKAIIKVKIYNHSSKAFEVKKGDKICQGVPQLVPYFSDILNLDTDRQGAGFGSSDRKEF